VLVAMVVYLYASNWQIQLQHISAELSSSHHLFLLIASASGFSLRAASSISIVTAPKNARPRQMILDGMFMYLERVPMVPKSSRVNISCILDLFILSMPFMYTPFTYPYLA
jgi:hypothetical protein